MMNTMASGSANSYCSQIKPVVITNAGAPKRLFVEHWVAMVEIPTDHQLKLLPPR